MDSLPSLFYTRLQRFVLSEKQLEENGFPLPDKERRGMAVVSVSDASQTKTGNSRVCCRCNASYEVDPCGLPVLNEPCFYHLKRRPYTDASQKIKYRCCNGDEDSEPCGQAKCHVSDPLDAKKLSGFVTTRPLMSVPRAFAIDCEMCYTTAGFEIVHVSIVAENGTIVYDSLVKPDCPVLDYNTRFSGVTEESIASVKTTLIDVQSAILSLVSDKSVLIGHSLENDMLALKLFHGRIVDTSIVFPHKLGLQYRMSLKTLSLRILKKPIQDTGLQ